VTKFVDGSDPVMIEAVGLPFFYCWSPDSRYIAWLANSPNGPIATRFVDLHDRETWAARGIEVMLEHPVFITWCSDSRRLILHTQHNALKVVDFSGDTTPVGGNPQTADFLRLKRQRTVRIEELPIPMGFFCTPVIYPLPDPTSTFFRKIMCFSFAETLLFRWRRPRRDLHPRDKLPITRA